MRVLDNDSADIADEKRDRALHTCQVMPAALLLWHATSELPPHRSNSQVVLGSCHKTLIKSQTGNTVYLPKKKMLTSLYACLVVTDGCHVGKHAFHVTCDAQNPHSV